MYSTFVKMPFKTEQMSDVFLKRYCNKKNSFTCICKWYFILLDIFRIKPKKEKKWRQD